MFLHSVYQDEFAKVEGPYDLAVCASGYESRARFVATELAQRNIEVRSKFVFTFKEHMQDCARGANDRCFKELNYKDLPCSGRSTMDARKCFESALHDLKNLETARLLIDISCMTRVWYGEIIHILLASSKFRDLHVEFAYTSAEFVEPLGEYPPNRVAGPAPGFVGMALP